MIKKSVLISCIFLTLLGSESSLGQAKKFVAYEVESGLSSDYLNVIFQDSKGFIWAGTNNGLNRFDGYQFKVFNNIENDSTSLSNNWITSILEDSNGNLWIGTEGGGLNQYNSNSGKFRSFQHSDTDPTSISSNMVISLHEDSQNRLWVGTQEGLNLMNKEDFTFKNWSNYNNCDECNHAISSIEGDYKGNLWIGDETYGLYYFNVTTETFSQAYEAIDSKSGSLSFVNDLLLDNNHLWIGTANGPYRMNLSNSKITKFDLVSNKSNEIFNDFVIRIRKDQRGEIWICTEGSGVAAYDENNQRFEVYKSEKNSNLGLTSNAVADVVVDYSDNLWVATRGGGINKLNLKNRIFEHFESQPSHTGTLVNSEVRALLQEQDGTIWIGTNKGLSRYNRKNNRFKNYVKDFKFKSDVSAPRIRLIHRSKNNDLWVSSQSGGLYKYNSIEDRFILDQVYSNNTLSNNARKISYIYEKSDDLLWLFTDGTGIIQYNLKTRKIQQILSKSTDNNLSKLAIYCVEVHTDGQLWMGTDDGLFLFDTNTLQHQVWKKIIGEPNSLADNKIRALYKDEESNNLWVGTRNGLSKYDFASEQFSLFREEDGLASNVVFGVLPAPNSQLIITTPKGLSRFNTKTEEFKNTVIPQNESLDMGGHAVGLNGELIVGGPDGFSIFHPKDLNDNPYIPKIVLTNFKVNNENANLNIDVSQLASIELDYDQNDLAFEFAALEFTKPKNNQYEYFLEGYNEEWIKHVNKHDVTFTNLNPGDYVFRIRGSNNDGIWNEEGVSLSIKISRPFWTTWWFRTIGILIILSGVLYYNRWKAGRIRANKLELNNKIDEATAKVNAQNSELISQKEKLLHTIEEIKHIVKEAGESGNFKIRIDLEDKQGEWRDLAKSINEMFDSISKPFNEINHIVNQMALGDLTLRYSENAQGDVKELAENLNKSLDIIVDLLTDISNQVDTIRLSSDDMLVTTQEINISTGEIAMSISEMSDGANRQVIRIDESSNLLEGILKFSNEMKEQAKSIDDATISGVDKCLAGIEYINNLDKEMKKILEFSAKTDDSIQTLSKRSIGITAVLRIIKEIAAQTNLLALNAAIEAAQAGDAGRGFAVVAEEIRKLSESSKKSAGEIEELIGGIQNDTSSTAQLITEMGSNIIKGEEATKLSLKAFEEISSGFNDTLEKTQQIVVATNQQSEDLVDVSTIINDIIVIAEETAAGTEETASSSSELSAGMQNHEEKSKQVSAITNELREKVNQFKLK